MGLVYAEVILSNMQQPELAPLQERALVDPGALHLCIPQHVALQLKLQELERREVIFADGEKRLVPYVGPLIVKIANRMSLSGAMVLGDEVLLGAIPMEDMDLVIRPATREVVPNPQNPNIAVSVAKSPRP
jgi:clan AA aspartic protease